MNQTVKTAATKRVRACVVLTALWLAGAACGFAADAPAAGNAWTLKTDDTHLVLAVRENRIFIESLKSPTQNWNWTPAPSPVALPGVNGKKVEWTFRDAAETRTNGHEVTLRFTCAEPALELQSLWRARPGVGPVEHQPTIRNNSTGAVAFAGEDLVAADLKLVSDQAAHLFPVPVGAVGYGEGTPLPYQMIQVGKTHGVYLAYDYGCGKFESTVTRHQIASRWWAAGIKNTATAPGETFRCPGIMIQTYRGDEDDGANGFRRWFWTYEITPSLRANPQEPPIVTAYSLPEDGMPDYLVQDVKTRGDLFAAMGIGMLKTDAWYNRTGHARSAELAAACHKHGLKLSLYWDGLIPIETLKAEFDKSRFDFYRMDQYQRGVPFDVNDYHSVKAFNEKIDAMTAYGEPNWRLENCCNGGNLRNLDLCRRMTFMTHSDDDSFLAWFNHVYHWSYLICPIQLRNDYHTGGEGKPWGRRSDVATVRGLLLGACYTGAPSWWTPEDIALLTHVFHRYNNRQRPILRGADVYRILPFSARQWLGIQYHNTFINRGSVLLWQNGGPTSQVVRLKGLDRSKTYSVTFEDARDRNGERTGAQLMEEGLNVPMGSNASEIVWINCPELSVDPGTLSFAVVNRSEKAPVKPVTIAYRQGPDLNKAFAVRAADSWVKAVPGSGAGHGQTFSVSVEPGDLPEALHTSTIVVTRPDIAEKIEIPIRLRLGVPVPKVITMTPRNGRCVPKGEMRMSAAVLDQFGEPFPAKIRWSVSGGGTIDAQGVFRSDGVPGDYVVTASVEGPSASSVTAPLKVWPLDLVARWKFDETNGTVAADAWGDFPGALVGGPAWGPGKRGGALRLNGKGQYVDTKWSLEGLRLPCTFAFWVNPAATQDEYADIFGNHAGSTVGLVMQQEGKALNKYYFGYGSTPAGGSAGSVQLTANEWQHVAVVCDGKAVIIYVNGKEAARGKGGNPITPNPNLNFRLGSGYSEGRFFSGALDDFRIYGRALSADEVQAVME